MVEAQWQLVGILIGLICFTNGRVLTSLNLEGNSQSALRGNELTDYTSGNSQEYPTADVGGRYKQQRLSEAEFTAYNLREPNGPGTYAFGYDNVVDPTGNEQFRSEEKLQNGTIIGEYGYTDYKNKKIVRVTYTADIRGYRAKTEVLPLDMIY